MKYPKVWFITGSSKGLGLTLTQKLLAEGYRVAATSRSLDALKTAVGTEETDYFLPLQVDLAQEQDVQTAIRSVISKFGHLDVVVNNAGYGQQGTFESLTDQEIRTHFDINVFSIFNVLRHAIPHLRKAGSGHIFNISSIGGFKGGYSGWGSYSATKFAVSGLTEALAAEVNPFGISATVVYPGAFRTNFLTKESLAISPNPISAYTKAQASIDRYLELSGKQQGDPEKAADVLIQAAATSNPPLHLFLGPDAYAAANEKIKSVIHDLEKHKDVTLSTSFKE
ncbi:short-chain dehydrogenase/reductase [Paenibacillus sp. BIHB 4019]|uniref:Short-chain dehydrogenase/reductase n=1 Tax=Paenibacillus sp. BIHB 4019 TaxID=1870819 RepID=A0A1B2DFZ4_9BACL|nr:SDR family NAD(P)-dependent oxidoreductase [Paenibacillus sp. BIHB 4019]ANY66633.1 short-chain dehydrogenase/reductase [Paenibacillus sp. BIHB 4019]